MEALSIDGFDSEKRLTLLESYKDTEMCEDIRGFVISGIGNCAGLPLKLTQVQKELVAKPCTTSRVLFSSAPFEEIWALLDACPDLMDIVQLFHQFDIHESLGLDDYKTMAQNATGYYALMRSLVSQMDADAMGLFTEFWKKGGCSLLELRRIERWSSEHPGQDWDSLLSTYSGYINLLYGKRFKVMDLGKTEGYQQSILIYAITQSKKRFIRLVNENMDVFLALPPGSFLFQEDLYRKCLNLNELTERDLKDCAWMKALQLPADRLILGRRYSFQELRVLYGASDRCISLYNALCSESQDHRLKVFRQIRKRDILWKDITQQELFSLAANLDRKPMYDWLQEDFRQIRDLTAEDTARILAHLEEVRHLLPSLQNRNDVLLVLRNLDSLEQFHSVGSLKDGILQTDKSWLALLSEMELSQKFQELYRENIIKFICGNGAQIAETYRECLDSGQQEAFFRIVKAELLGRLEEVKYFGGDLQRELNILLAPALLDAWKNNLHLKQDSMEAGEYDDFYSTMLLGVQPQKTCLSYTGGIYRECLLSSFDANKKILYVTLGGRVVGRAFLRLTKGRMAGAEPFSGARDRFTWWTLMEDGHKAKMPRNCTIDYKIEAVSKFVRWTLLGYRKGQRLRPEDAKAHEMHMGFSAEERRRYKVSPNPMFYNKYPLVEMRLTRADNYRYTLEKWGLDTKASACAFCPFHRNYFYQYIKETEPETYAAVIGLDNLLRDKTPMLPMKSKLFISRDRKRIADLTPEDCNDAEYFEYHSINEQI